MSAGVRRDLAWLRRPSKPPRGFFYAAPMCRGSSPLAQRSGAGTHLSSRALAMGTPVDRRSHFMKEADVGAPLFVEKYRTHAPSAPVAEPSFFPRVESSHSTPAGGRSGVRQRWVGTHAMVPVRLYRPRTCLRTPRRRSCSTRPGQCTARRPGNCPCPQPVCPSRAPRPTPLERRCSVEHVSRGKGEDVFAGVEARVRSRLATVAKLSVVQVYTAASSSVQAWRPHDAPSRCSR